MSKEENWNFEKYTNMFLSEIASNQKALKRLHELRKMSEAGKIVFLIGFERNNNKTHTSIIKKLIERVIK